MDNNKDEILTTKQAADFLRVTPVFLRSIVNTTTPPLGVKLGRVLRFSRRRLEAHIRGEGATPTTFAAPTPASGTAISRSRADASGVLRTRANVRRRRNGAPPLRALPGAKAS